LRSTVDAVIVGGNTVCVDNPYLTTHNLTLHNPLRIVISRSLNLPKKANLWNQEEAKTLIFTQPNCNYDILAHLKSLGLEVIQIDQLTPKKVMNVLYEKGLSKVLWEAGSRLSTAAVLDGCVQKILAFIAPKIIGGKKAPTPLEDLGLNLMKDAIELENISFTALEPDFLVEGYLNLRLK
jgi:diaminohydroxyphosphoribosylaminopyrimidine deaminase/5-amino-6-(5-phosphoribosylamino)uracil reductase